MHDSDSPGEKNTATVLKAILEVDKAGVTEARILLPLFRVFGMSLPQEHTSLRSTDLSTYLVST